MKPFFVPRFSLRTLLAVVAISSAFFAWLAEGERYERQQQICDQLIQDLRGPKPIRITPAVPGRFECGCGIERRPAVPEFKTENSKSWRALLHPGGLREVTDATIHLPDRAKPQYEKWQETTMDAVVKLTTLRTVTIYSSPKLGDGEIARLKELPELTSLKLNADRTADISLLALSEIRTLEELSVEVASTEPIAGLLVADRGTRCVSPLTSLAKLHLRGVVVRDDIFGSLPGLRQLFVQFCDMSPEALSGLSRCKRLESMFLMNGVEFGESSARCFAAIPNLHALYIFDDARDDALLALGASRSIETLVLWECDRITERGFSGLESLPLVSLDLSCRTVELDARMLEHIARVKGLRHAALPCGAITDEKLAIFAEMKDIESLTLYGVAGTAAPTPLLSDQQLAWLQTRLPNATIVDAERQRMQAAPQSKQFNQALAGNPAAVDAGEPLAIDANEPLTAHEASAAE